MLGELLIALPVAILVGVVPGWCWATSLTATRRPAERLTYAIAFSIVLVPVTAWVLEGLVGSGVTLFVSVASVCIVSVAGLLLHVLPGRAKRNPEPVYSVPEGGEDAEGRKTLHSLLLPAVSCLVLVRAYLGPVLFDWPFIRGVDQYIQAGLTQEMLTRGTTESYMVYPPGFHLLVAAVSRISGLEPLDLFALLGPALLLLPTLALYTLATTLWGHRYGVLAAAFSGLVLTGSYQYLSEARYPQMIAGQFLIVLTVAALFRLYAAPSVRSGLIFAFFGSSVVLYHHVASFYLALLLALVAAVSLPYLLLKERGTGLALFVSLAGLGVLSTVYAWDTYDLGETLGNLLSGGSEKGATGAAVTGAIGTQLPYPIYHLPGAVSVPVLLLGVAGLVLLLADRPISASIPRRMAKIALLLWVALMFTGSRTSLSGFPERFELDLGVPLALLAAFATGRLLYGLLPTQPSARTVGSGTLVKVAAALALVLISGQTMINFVQAGGPSPEDPTATSRVAMNPEIQTAGRWLESHNTGGNIAASPYIESVPSRALLVLGDYSGVQSFRAERIERDRDLPPSGQGPPLDMLWLLGHPQGERSERVIERHDIRYIVFDRDDAQWLAYARSTGEYQRVFDNEEVIIYEPRASAAGSGENSNHL